MIGYDTGGPGGSGWDPQPAADRIREMWRQRDTWLPRVTVPLTPIWGWVEEVAERVVTVLETIEVLDPDRVERWVTAGDERTCPACAPLHGRTWGRCRTSTTAPCQLPLPAGLRLRGVAASGGAAMAPTTHPARPARLADHRLAMRAGIRPAQCGS